MTRVFVFDRNKGYNFQGEKQRLDKMVEGEVGAAVSCMWHTQLHALSLHFIPCIVHFFFIGNLFCRLP